MRRALEDPESRAQLQAALAAADWTDEERRKNPPIVVIDGVKHVVLFGIGNAEK